MNSDALAIPFSYYSGSWRAGVRSDYPFDLEEWIGHLSSLKDEDFVLDVNRMHLDFENHIRFVSNIPQGGGLGSSGGVTAAFYDRYVYSEKTLEENLSDIRDTLSHMESYFHGDSSGVDPLVSLTDKSYVSFEGRGALHDLKIPNSLSLHVILTNTDRQTASLIEFFKESMATPKFAKRIHDELIPAVHQFVSAWGDGRVSDVEKAFTVIGNIEYEIFKPMVTKEIKPLWRQSLESEEFSIKLCGAGGGGAYLACGELPEDIPFKTLRIV